MGGPQPFFYFTSVANLTQAVVLKHSPTHGQPRHECSFGSCARNNCLVGGLPARPPHGQSRHESPPPHGQSRHEAPPFNRCQFGPGNTVGSIRRQFGPQPVPVRAGGGMPRGQGRQSQPWYGRERGQCHPDRERQTERESEASCREGFFKPCSGSWWCLRGASESVYGEE